MGLATRGSFGLAGLVLIAAACGGGGGSSGNGRVKVLVTDKRFDLDLVQEALVHVTKITLSPFDDDEGEKQDGHDDEDDGDHDDGDHDDGDHDDDGDGGHHGDHKEFVLYPGPGIVVSLLDLRDGISAEFATGEIPAGSYRVARLYIDDAKLTLTNGNVYSTADGNLDLTQANKIGLKIFFKPPLEVVAGEEIPILLDFDLSKTFIPVPCDDPLNATRFLVRPGIRATTRVDTGDLNGTITEDDGAGGLMAVDLATVYVLPPGETDLTKAVTTTASVSTGSYAVLGLSPGTYDVLAVKDAKQKSATGVQVEAGNITIVDLKIE
jgi:DNA gyrase inhibitor GyrI